jgi:hypothetical protein
MGTDSGAFTSLRAAATFAANDTWYAVDNTIEIGPNHNCLRLYVTVGVASAGNMEFYVKHSPPSTVTQFDLCGAGDAPELWGPLVFTGAAAKSLELQGINLLPHEDVEVYFRASAGATTATVAISALSFESAGSSVDVATGDIELSVDTLSADLSDLADAVYADDDTWVDDTSKHMLSGGIYQSTPQTITDGATGPIQLDQRGNIKVSSQAILVIPATGAAAIDIDTNIAANWQLLSITLHLSGAATTSEDFTVVLDANDDAAYDTTLFSLDLSVSSGTDFVITPEDDGIPRFYESGDELNIDFPNTETNTYGVRIVYRLV